MKTNIYVGKNVTRFRLAKKSATETGGCTSIICDELVNGLCVGEIEDRLKCEMK